MISCMFRQTMWPSSGKQNAKAGYIKE